MNTLSLERAEVQPTKPGWCPTPHALTLEWRRHFTALEAHLLEIILDRTKGCSKPQCVVERARIRMSRFMEYTGKSDSSIQPTLTELAAKEIDGFPGVYKLVDIQGRKGGRGIVPSYSVNLEAVGAYVRDLKRVQVSRCKRVQVSGGRITDSSQNTDSEQQYQQQQRLGLESRVQEPGESAAAAKSPPESQNPTPKQQHTARTVYSGQHSAWTLNSRQQQQTYSETAAAIRTRFPVGDEFVQQLVDVALEVRPGSTDAEIAAVVQCAIERNRERMRSAGLLRHLLKDSFENLVRSEQMLGVGA